MGIMRPARKVHIDFELHTGENDLTDDELKQYYQGTANVLYFLLNFGMGQVPPPNAPITVAKVTVGPIHADKH